MILYVLYWQETFISDLPHINTLKKINGILLNDSTNIVPHFENYKHNTAYLESTYHQLPLKFTLSVQKHVIQRQIIKT